MKAIAIISGRGGLPPLLADHLRAAGLSYQVVRFESDGMVWAQTHPLIEARFASFGALFDRLKASGISHVCFAGGMTRPALNPAEFDQKTQEIAPRLLGSLGKGDDATLREIAAIFEDEGLRVLGAHEVMPDLLPGAGVLGAFAPDPADLADIERAAEIVRALGAADVGQGAVVAQGICLGLESIQGTDQMLDFVARTAARFRRDPVGAKGVLWKAAKPGQDLRMDMPALGPDSVHAAQKAGLAGIAFAAGQVIMLDQAETIRAADAAGLFLFGKV